MELRIWNRGPRDLRPDPYFTADDFKVDAVLFETCLRRLWLQLGPEVSGRCAPDYSGIGAYGFLMRVLCGLESPFLGETEVLGQFRDQTAKAPGFLSGFLQKLNQDVKQVRTEHLMGLGSVSYGGICRQLIPANSHVVLVGAGSLGREIAQWIGKSSVEFDWLASRARVENGRAIREWRGSEVPFGACLIIAAPLTRDDLENLKEMNVIFDFRAKGEGSLQAKKVFSFADIQQIARRHQAQYSRSANQAALAIEDIARTRFLESKARPFGWEDLCG